MRIVARKCSPELIQDDETDARLMINVHACSMSQLDLDLIWEVRWSASAVDFNAQRTVRSMAAYAISGRPRGARGTMSKLPGLSLSM